MLIAARVPVGTTNEALHSEQVRDDACVVSGVGSAVESPMLHQTKTAAIKAVVFCLETCLCPHLRLRVFFDQPVHGVYKMRCIDIT